MKTIQNLSIIKQLILLISLFSVILLVSMIINGVSTHHLVIEDSKTTTLDLTESAHAIFEHYYHLYEEGEMEQQEAFDTALESISAIRFGPDMTDYIFVLKKDGTSLAMGDQVDKVGRNIEAAKAPDGSYPIRSLIALAENGGGYLEYKWEKKGSTHPVTKLSYAEIFEPWQIVVGTGIYLDDLEDELRVLIIEQVIMFVVALLITGTVGLIIAQFITKPISTLTQRMNILAKGDLKVDIPYQEMTNEIGEMSHSLLIFRDNMVEREKLEEKTREEQEKQVARAERTMKSVNEFETMIEEVTRTLDDAAKEMQAFSEQLNSSMRETTEQCTSVASASQQASVNVQTVASAAEELTASIAEIARNVEDTAQSARSSSTAANASKDKLEILQNAIMEIDSVIQAISDVAEQTNLLALNATIEAARAGEAGKGFAVVASEVKSLANETHKMTEEISQKVATIKTSAFETISSVSEIIESISEVDNKTSNVAAAVEEQTTSTNEISRNVQEAAKGTEDVSKNIGDVQRSADESSSATSQLLSSADQLAVQSGNLKSSVERFLNEVRTA